MCIDIMEIWFGIANGQISSNFYELSAHNMIMAGYYILTFLFEYVSGPFKLLHEEVPLVLGA